MPRRKPANPLSIAEPLDQFAALFQCGAADSERPRHSGIEGSRLLPLDGEPVSHAVKRYRHILVHIPPYRRLGPFLETRNLRTWRVSAARQGSAVAPTRRVRPG
jgi:hypothetical protein